MSTNLITIDRNYFFGLVFENSKWYIQTSRSRTDIVYDDNLKRNILRLSQDVNFRNTDTAGLLEIDLDYYNPHTIYEDMIDCLNMTATLFKYSSKLGNIIEDENPLALFNHLYDNKHFIVSNTYPYIGSVSALDVDNILDKILTTGIQKLTLIDKKKLETYSKKL